MGRLYYLNYKRNVNAMTDGNPGSDHVLQTVGLGKANLTPLATKTYDFTTGVLSSDFSFTRASSAWYYNSSGILTQASSNVPRFDYNPSTLAINGLLVEGQATNLVYPSIPDGTYSATASTISATGAVTAPDGTTVSAAFVDNTSTSSHYYIAGGATSYTSGQSYTSSVYALANSNRILQLTAQSTVNSGGKFASFDLNAKTVIFDTGTSPATIQSLPGGWVRCTFTWTATATSVSGDGVVALALSSNATSLLPSYTGNSTGFYVWGQQLEANNFATSPIPTTTTVATRLADSVINSSIGGWFNNSQGTFTTEFITAPVVQEYQVVSAFSDGTFLNRLDMFLGSGTSAIYWQNSSYPSAVSTSVAITANGVHKLGYSYNGIVLQAAQDGVLTGTITGTPLVIPTLNQLNIGSDPVGQQLFGWIRKFSYWNNALSTSQLPGATQ